jgi:NADH-quinone oxidoreductase subunit L
MLGLDWIAVGQLHVRFAFLIDPLSCVMALTVSGVAFLIHVYSIGYMHGEENFSRYFTWLNLFTTSMLLLVLANSFLLMFVGWELVGLCSYLLIGYWFDRPSAAAAGQKAFIVNRVGDCAFILGILALFTHFQTLDFDPIFSRAPTYFGSASPWVTLITLALFIGATGKSAQIPLYVWLPDAMEGPTPVSALIHAATMVTAGVYMVARCSVLFALAPVTLAIVAIIGAATAIYAASIAMVQNDIKRVLAYSTISQLGYMFLACGAGAFAAGIFHLMTHAFFKALLFLGAGSVMHAMQGELDIRKMGGLRRYMPITYATFLIAALAISGIPPLAGFFSKDAILWSALSRHDALGYFCWAIAWLTAGLTAFYMFRIVLKPFWGESRMDKHVEEHVHESPRVMTIPLMALAVLSVIGGFVGIPIIRHANVFEPFLEPVFQRPTEIITEGQARGLHGAGIEGLAMLVTLALVLIGIAWAYRWYVRRPGRGAEVAESTPGRMRLYALLRDKYRVDELYAAMVVDPGHRLAQGLWQRVDVAIIDGAVNGVAWLVGRIARLIRLAQTGQVRNYALATLLGAAVILLLLLYRP